MHRIVSFWKKDFINKMIILVTAVLIFGVIGNVVILYATPSGRALIGQLFPTPTLSFNAIFTHSAETASAQTAQPTAIKAPTMTTRPFTPVLPTETPTPISPTPTATLPLPTPTPSPTRTPTALPGMSCIPDNPVQKGKAVEIIDGNTIKVLIDGNVYNVRYIGLDIPTDGNFALLAAAKNGELVWTKEITLIGDTTDKDEVNRLLRYVKIGDIFVNLELIQAGLASASSAIPAISCEQVFKEAERSAIAAGRGMWFFTPTVPAP